MTLTHKDLHTALNCGSPNRHQCKLLGISYPLPGGWLRKLIGTEMTEAEYAGLVALKKTRPVREPQKAISDRLRVHYEQTAIIEFTALLARHDAAGVEKIATMFSYARSNGLTVNMTVSQRA